MRKPSNRIITCRISKRSGKRNEDEVETNEEWTVSFIVSNVTVKGMRTRKKTSANAFALVSQK